MSLLSKRGDPCVANRCASYFCSCQPLTGCSPHDSGHMTNPAIWRIPRWALLPNPMWDKMGNIGIPTHTGNTRGNNRGDHREIPSPLRNSRKLVRLHTQCICAVRGKLVRFEVGWRVRRMLNHGRVESERAEVLETIRHLQFYNYLQPERGFWHKFSFSWLSKYLIWPKLEGRSSFREIIVLRESVGRYGRYVAGNLTEMWRAVHKPKYKYIWQIQLGNTVEKYSWTRCWGGP